MVEAARQCASYPHDIGYQDTLRKTAEDLRDVTIVAATTPALRQKLVDRVQVCARRAVSTATQCISAAQASHPHNTNVATREALRVDTQDLSEQIPPLIDSIKANTDSPQDANNQSELMYVAEVFLHVSILFLILCSILHNSFFIFFFSRQHTLFNHQEPSSQLSMTNQ